MNLLWVFLAFAPIWATPQSRLLRTLLEPYLTDLKPLVNNTAAIKIHMHIRLFQIVESVIFMLLLD